MNSDALSKMTAPDMIRTQCRAVFAAFNMIFGDGTDRAVFGGKCSLMEAMEAFGRLVGEIKKPKKLVKDMTSKLKSQASALGWILRGPHPRPHWLSSPQPNTTRNL